MTRLSALVLLLISGFLGCGESTTQTARQSQASDVGASDMGRAEPVPKRQTFRVSQIILRDPHLFRDPPFFSCADITYDAPAGFDSANDAIAKSLIADRNQDLFLDFSVLFSIEGDTFSIGNGTCSVNGRCESEFIDETSKLTRRTTGNCFETFDGTTDYSPEPRRVDGPCFRAEPVDLLFSIGGSTIRLKDAQVAGTIRGQNVEGVIAGYLTLEEARLTKIRRGTLDEFLPGAGGCMGGDGRDSGAGFTTGWWLYLDFDAKPAVFAESGSGCSTVSASPKIGFSLLFLLAIVRLRRRNRGRPNGSSLGSPSDSSR